MQTVSVAWSMWYENTHFEMTFPDTFQVTVSHMKGGPDIGDAGIRKALAEPIGAPRLRDLARGRRDAAIVIDDLTRPTPTYRTLPYILEELAAGGLGDDKVRIVCGVAAHRAVTRPDLIKKIGLDLVERIEVVVHNAQDNLEYYGLSSQGIPIWVNRDFARSDLKLTAGMITPRGRIFGGGSKLILPGVSGWQSIYANHSYCPDEVFREHIDEVARIVGLEYVVNPMLNEEGGVMAMVAGDPQAAYWKGVEIGKVLYKSLVPMGMDAIICNAWPKDTEGTQAAMAAVPLYGAREQALRENGTLVITSACPEGLGYHSVMGPGTLFRMRSRSGIGGSNRAVPQIRQVMFSPGMNRYDVKAQFGPQTIFCKTWPEVVALLEKEYGPAAKVGVFPCGAIQYGGD